MCDIWDEWDKPKPKGHRTRIVNRHVESYDVYIGRGTKWGNPFHIDESKGETREIVIEKYYYYMVECVRTGKITYKDFLSIKDKKLGCSCKPNACHGDVLISFLDRLFP